MQRFTNIFDFVLIFAMLAENYIILDMDRYEYETHQRCARASRYALCFTVMSGKYTALYGIWAAHFSRTGTR